jgi:hypothetical protein
VRLSDKYQDLSPLVSGSSFNQLFALIYKLAAVRYATVKQLNAVNPKIGTKNKVSELTRLGYLSRSDGGFLFTALKGFELLKKEGFNTEILQKRLQGNYSEHQEKLTGFLLDEMQSPDYYAVIYPDFTYIKPDACLVWKRDNQYKIEFIELEVSPKDSEYLPGKKQRYEQLARDIAVYSKWWKRWAELLKLPYCRLDQFCFGVRYV